MSKRVLLHYPTLGVGGAEKSSLRMIRALCDRGWDVTLVLTTGGGALEAEVDPRVRVIRLRPRAYGVRFSRARGGLRLAALPDLMAYGAMRLIGAARALPFRFRHYDAAVALLMGMSSQFIRRGVRARTRAVWIRNDLAGADPTGQVSAALAQAAPEIDHFICVSEVSRQSLVDRVPAARDKAVVVYNILAPEEMRTRADETSAPFPPAPQGVVTLLSVCRLSDTPKGLFRMARLCRALVDKGLAFRWFIAGDGPDRARLEAEITRLGIADHITLLGPLTNPFPAYKACDAVAMLSNYEGLCGVVNEARVLGKPIIASRVSGINEQLTNRVNGLVVDQDETAILDGLTRIITDADLRAHLAKGGYPHALLDDATKLDRLEELFLGQVAGDGAHT